MTIEFSACIISTCDSPKSSMKTTVNVRHIRVSLRYFRRFTTKSYACFIERAACIVRDRDSRQIYLQSRDIIRVRRSFMKKSSSTRSRDILRHFWQIKRSLIRNPPLLSLTHDKSVTGEVIMNKLD